MSLKKKILKIVLIAIMMLSIIQISNMVTAANQTPSVAYSSYVEKDGWETDFKNRDGEISGTTGEAKALKGIKIKIENLPSDVKIKYKTHVSEIGWQQWFSAGQVAGDKNQKESIEAIQIELENSLLYNIQYRVHISKRGWQEWKENGSIAGTVGEALAIEAIEIKFVKKDANVIYKAHNSFVGWQAEKKDGQTSGAVGQGKPLEAIYIDSGKEFEIEYQAHVKFVGWQGFRKNGEMAGTIGQSLHMEAIQIKLKEQDKYSIAYRAYVTQKGWQDWSYDGETAGTTGQSLPIEGIEIKIVPKVENRAKVYIDTASRFTVNQYAPFQRIYGWVMRNNENIQIEVSVDNQLVENINTMTRLKREDVLNSIKGYGGEEKNPKPGFECGIDLSKYGAGLHEISIKAIDNGKVISQKSIKYNYVGIYGQSGLKRIGDGRGSDLEYYQYGSGPNVMFATFTVHGYEDKWDKDGEELRIIADNFYQELNAGAYADVKEKWTVYIFPEVNPDGRRHGWTQNGPGRNTLFSTAVGNRGIDLNRSWQINGVPYTRYTDSRNYNGTAGFQTYEASYLRDFLIANKSKEGQTILIDLHGWTNQLIGDAEICNNYFAPRFPNADKSSLGRYGTGYLVNWARSSLHSNTKMAKSALIELPSAGINNHNDVVRYRLSEKYIESMILTMRGMGNNRNMRTANNEEMGVLEISNEEQYEVALAGILKQEQPQKEEIQEFMKYAPTGTGIWISEKDRDNFLAFIHTQTNSKYKINQYGFLEVDRKAKNLNEYDKKIETVIKEKRQVLIDMSGNYYSIDFISGEIAHNPFEQMDAYQVYEYVEKENSKILILNANKNQKLTGQELMDGLIKNI